jgi:hypothetical protein
MRILMIGRRGALGRCHMMAGEGSGDNGGEGGQGGGTPPAEEKPAGTEGGAPPANDEGAEKPFLGEEGAKNGKEGTEEGKQETPKPVEEAEYVAALVKDEALLGDDKSVQLDSALFKAVVPTLQKYGVSPEAANALANNLAKAQIEQAREASKARIEYFERMKQESMRTYTQKDFEQINKGIDKWFKPDGVMNRVIRNSELGADPEFLALMHHLGEAVKVDGIAGAGAGGGGSAGDANGIEGLSKIW